MITKTPVIIGLLVGTFLITGCTSEEEPKINFQRDVSPILTQNCGTCHSPNGEGYQKSQFSVESYDALMKGTQYGPVIMPGDSLNSTLNRMVEGRVDPKIQMPHGGKKLSEQDIKALKLWVNQGAKNN